MTTRDSFYLVELYSGNGSVSSILSKVLGLKAIRLDKDPETGADINIDLTNWGGPTASEVKRLAGVTSSNRKRAIIWASPPCTEYSKLKEGRARDLEQADACVAVVQRIAADLDAALVLIENPATGLLKTRDVIAPYPHSYELDYCQYGYSYRKRTMIWSTVELPASFVPKTCPGFPECPCTYRSPVTGKCGHIVDVCREELSVRISVPDQLVSLLGRALAEMLPPLAHKPEPPLTPVQRQQQQKSWEVNYIYKGALEDGKLWLQVYWVGFDHPTWIKSAKLDAHPSKYDFFTPETRTWVLSKYKMLQRQKRKLQQEVQQQQAQQRTTRRMSAVTSGGIGSSGGSGSSSGSGTSTGLEDGGSV